MIHYEGGVTQRRWHTRKWHTIHHVDQARDQNSIAQAGLVAEEKERKEGQQTIFFTNRDAEEVQAIKKSRKVRCQIHWRSAQNAEHWIHLSATQERILADSVYAISTFQSMLKECVVKKLSIKVETRIVRKTTYASTGPEVTLRSIWDG